MLLPLLNKISRQVIAFKDFYSERSIKLHMVKAAECMCHAGSSQVQGERNEKTGEYYEKSD